MGSNTGRHQAAEASGTAQAFAMMKAKLLLISEFSAG
jgi:hypothetical protein